MPDMKSVEERLSTWRRFAGDAMPPEPVSRGIDRVASLHRAQLERTGRLALENLKAHDQFCAAIEAYVIAGADERSEEHQQRVADYAAYLLRVYGTPVPRRWGRHWDISGTDCPVRLLR
jgi:hypothetical protein